MASQTSSDDSTVPATAYNPDSNTLIIVVTLEDPTHRTQTKLVEAFRGRYDDEVSGSADKGEARGTLTYSHNFKHGDSARFNAEDNALFSDVTITFTDTELTLGGSPATAVFKGKGHIRPGTGTGTWDL